ncbi:hypothetical protein, partial [Pseudoalteromonas sp. NZS71_1]|uniref:hypothetical protein n=1 Tax=Pseudoalteromonas sp. NZS71_1 TaxID=2792072 RepID=UPI001E610F9D
EVFIPSLEYDLLLMLEAQFLIVFIILTSKLFSKSAASLNLFVYNSPKNSMHAEKKKRSK